MSKIREEEEKRTSPQIFYSGGIECYALLELKREHSNRSALNKKGGDLLDYYLLGRSIELFLKAFLRGNGMNLDRLRKKISHNLEKAFRKSQTFGLSELVSIEEKEIAALKILNHQYSKKRLEYSMVGMYTLPEFPLIFGVAEKLKNNLKSFSAEKTKEFRKNNPLG